MTVFEAVTFSLIAHAVAVAIAIGVNLWSVAFPDASPAMMISFTLAEPAPPPPPPPPPPKAAARPQPLTQQIAVKPEEVLAPTVIPDEIPVVQTQIVAASVAAAPTGVEGGVDWGTVGGSLGGVLDGDLGGKQGGVAGSVSDIDPADHMIHVARDRPLPMFPVSQVYPAYPENARLNAWEDDLVVRYVIGKDGRIKNVTVLKAPQHDVFVDGTLRAIRSWRFKPMVRAGEKLEVVHELTIQYRLHQEG